VLGDEATGGELEDEAAIELPIEVEIEGVERLAHGIKKWDTTKGGPGTVAHAQTLLAGDRALIANLIGAI
jgi:hypothetical protein